MSKFLTIAAAALFLSAQDPEVVPNPDYAPWSGFKVGSWVKLKSVAAKGGEVTDVEMKLTELTEEKAVISIARKSAGSGTKFSQEENKETVPAKIKKGELRKKLGEGDEILMIGGKKLKCHWVKTLGVEKEVQFVEKRWTCGEIPGPAKIEILAGNPLKVKEASTAVEWKAAE